MYIAYYSSPLGMLKLVTNDQYLLELNFKEEDEVDEKVVSTQQAAITQSKILQQTIQELDEYFAGQRKDFTIPLFFEKGTEFQRAVWTELSNIPYSQVITYGEQSKRIGREKACRAVGMTNGKNPIAIIVPCHRVIGSNGKLTGYASGIWRKEWLLNHERSHTV